MSDSYVVVGAGSKCTNGSQPARLRLPFSHGVFINNKAQMNMTDAKPVVNIPVYGMCAVTKAVCVPGTTIWTGCKLDAQVENQPALMKSSKTYCACGGVISIEDDGQED